MDNTSFAFTIPESWDKQAAEDIAQIVKACDIKESTGLADSAFLPDWVREEWDVHSDAALTRFLEGYTGGLEVYDRGNDCYAIIGEIGTQEEMDFLAEVVSTVMRRYGIEQTATYTFGQEDAGVAVMGAAGAGFIAVSNLEMHESSEGAGMALVMEQFAEAVGWDRTVDMIVKAAEYHGLMELLKNTVTERERAGCVGPR